MNYIHSCDAHLKPVSPIFFLFKEHLTGDTEEHLDVFAQPTEERICVLASYRILGAAGV